MYELNDTHDKLEYIDTDLKEIDNTLEKYFENYNILQLSRVMENNSKSNNENTGANAEPTLKEKDVAEVVEICNQLWVINGLINEYMNNNLDFSDRVNSYKKLKFKLNDLKSSFNCMLNVLSLKVVNQLDEKLESIRTELLKSSKERFGKYLKIHDDSSIEFSKNIDSLSFEEFLKQCEIFIIEEISHVFNLNKVFSSWLDQIFFKFESGSTIVFVPGDLQIRLDISNMKDLEFSAFLKSIEQIIEFLNGFTKSISNIKEYSNLRSILGKLILKNLKLKLFEKKNVYPLIVEKLNYDEHKDDHLDSKLCNITKLYKISSFLSQEGWSKDRICELEFWIDDLTNSWVDNLIDVTIEDLKEFSIKLMDKEFSDDLKPGNLISIELEVVPASAPLVSEKHIENKPKLNETDDGWNNWNTNNDDDWDSNTAENDKKEKKESSLKPEIDQDDDGWGNDEDIDLDSEKDEDGDEDGWSAWGDEVKIDDVDVDDVKEPTISPPQSNESKPSYKYSKITTHIMKIFDKYMKNYQDLRDLHISNLEINETKELFKHGFKKLCISYFMIIQYDVKGIYGNEILFYNDFNKILEQCCSKYGVELTTCNNMNLNLLNSKMNLYHEKINKILEDYNFKIWNDNRDDDDSRLKEYSTEFLLRFKSKVDEVKFELFEFNSLNTQLVLNNFLKIIFQLFNSICDKILARKGISSYESAIWANIIDELTKYVILSNVNLNSKIEKIQTFEKLNEIKFILSSNLKEILDEFYNAKLFELETHEIISLIESLFIESEQRLKIINEIQHVRETTF